MKQESPYNLIVILGPTASGKTTLATQLAYKIGGEIISADSRQVYRSMNLGTGKDLEDYVVNHTPIPYHLIDIVDAGYKYNVYEYQNDFFKAFEDIRKRGKMPVMCGGTGMYIEAVLSHFKMVHVPSNPELRKKLEGKSLDELTQILSSFKKLHNTTDADTVKRAVRGIEIETYYSEHPEIEVELPELNPLIIGVKIDRELRREKITKRLKSRLDEGMVDEVRGILNSGVKAEDLIYYGLEYKYLTLYATGEISYQEMFEKLNIAIHQFAKRQMTWFRKMERSGFQIHWMDAMEAEELRVQEILNWL
ncbi:tRNA (adenosine(37)-N6)-dimethylallyltransferase MiaA [Plebeiibacterium marinum]|uniref:tRNA dimethylallyltransferase n=1 Tax=Plebeiibacterium marinum TaxID=2992111 RepID=A0AAE3MDX1_9BACT|nr:tRNA (adenosine(37)-N6)-dimethylallyltransferase MiaA [Plebeiobacterium marinum]MCW3805969.1 tRNA (adenosine(37)-N6)-dimethylallyltransferase MiaA [Plebeiobacterium marinum]